MEKSTIDSNEKMTKTGKSQKATVQKVAKLLLRLAFLTGSLALLYHLVDLSRLWELIRHVSPWVVVVAVGLAALTNWLMSLRWQLLNPDPTGQLRGYHYFSYLMISKTFNLVMPGALGGDLARSVLVYKALGSHRGINILAIMSDRVIGFSSIIVLGTIACLAAPVLPDRWKYMAMLGVMIALFVAGIIVATSGLVANFFKKILARFGRIGQKGINLLDTWHGVLKHYRENPSTLSGAFLLCLPIHLLWFFVVYLLARSVGIEVSFLSISMVTTLVWMITAIPLTFSGLGVRELSFVYLLSLQGVSADSAAALSLYQFGITILLGILGIPFLFFIRLK